MADESKLKQAKVAFKALCDMLDENEWHYSKDMENLKITCGVQGDDLPMNIRIEVDADRQLVVLLSEMPFSVPEDRRVELAVAVSAANYGMVDGNFDYNYLDGSILFRMTSSFMDSLVGKEMFNYMLMCACATIDRYNDKFFMVTKKEMSVEEILEFID